ncbi:MAG: glucose-6-phosphate isomerase [Calditrichaceae bacterium]|nr:glucose-6-phosphate isomerase [Calditrichaceae bacterium]MBN2707397.1 glucose-6-phosphate isomerase [Calditrichaceae bacterium]RQV93398.1 MAG: glucose-6-phosphate isomerase [Calditrichota bacterium]
MSLMLDFSNVMEENLGHEQGIKLADFERILERGGKIQNDLRQRAENGEIGFYKLPYSEDLAEEIETYAALVRERYDYYIHNGIGGSALGPIALHTSLRSAHYNMKSSPKMFFPDNIDPDWINELLDQIDVSKTLFHIVSKSGETAETAATTLFFMKYLKEKLGDNFYKNILFTTDPVKGLLNQIAREYPIKCFRIPPDVGGRFSVLSPVGLVSAAISGINIKELLAGAREMSVICDNSDLMKNPAFIFAAIHYMYMKRGKNISVMMPYSNKLRDMADWYCQLWAESLGKRFDVSGELVEVGQTPVKALGATDQHSQIQLYVEGPNDKIITFLEVESFSNNIPLNNYFTYINEFDYFKNRSLGELLNNEKKATELALTNNHRPNLTIKFPEVNEKSIGAFFFLLEAATAFAGGLLNINAFDQPGVEEGKIATYALMGRSGYETKRKEIETLLSRKKSYKI